MNKIHINENVVGHALQEFSKIAKMLLPIAAHSPELAKALLDETAKFQKDKVNEKLKEAFAKMERQVEDGQNPFEIESELIVPHNAVGIAPTDEGVDERIEKFGLYRPPSEEEVKEREKGADVGFLNDLRTQLKSKSAKKVAKKKTSKKAKKTKTKKKVGNK